MAIKLETTPENIELKTNRLEDISGVTSHDAGYPTGKAAKDYADTKFSASGGALGGELNMDGNRIKNLPAPGANNDPARKKDLDDSAALCEKLANKVTTLENATDDTYPSSKCVDDNLALLALEAEKVANRVDVVNNQSTNSKYPTAKAVWDKLVLKENAENKVSEITPESSAIEYPSAKAVYNLVSAVNAVKSVTTANTLLSALDEGVYLIDGSGSVKIQHYSQSNTYITVSDGFLAFCDKRFFASGKLDIYKAGTQTLINSGIVFGYDVSTAGSQTGYDYKSSEDLERVARKQTSISSSSTDVQYPSSKCVYDNLLLKEAVANKVTSLSNENTDTEYPSAKAVYDAIQAALYIDTSTVLIPAEGASE